MCDTGPLTCEGECSSESVCNDVETTAADEEDGKSGIIGEYGGGVGDFSSRVPGDTHSSVRDELRDCSVLELSALVCSKSNNSDSDVLQLSKS